MIFEQWVFVTLMSFVIFLIYINFIRSREDTLIINFIAFALIIFTVIVVYLIEIDYAKVSDTKKPITNDEIKVQEPNIQYHGKMDLSKGE